MILMFYPTSVAWLSVFQGIAETGTAKYFSNGTFVTFIGENLVNSGNYTVVDGGNGWCYETEFYDQEFPATCNTFSICPFTNSMIGCEVLGKGCLKECVSSAEWTNWYSARITGTAEA
jgi:hypothetical protein